MSFAGKVIVITGASDGIGAELARQLAREKPRLVLAAKIGLPGYTGYSASKFAQAGFFEALRTELAGTGVDVTLVFADVVATKLFSHAYGADGKPAGKVSAHVGGRAMPVEDCASRIVAALRGRRRELLTTPRARILPWLQLLAPGMVQGMLRPAARS